MGSVHTDTPVSWWRSGFLEQALVGQFLLATALVIVQQRRSRSRERSWWRTLHSHVLQAMNIGKQSSTLVDKILGSRTTSQADQSTPVLCQGQVAKWQSQQLECRYQSELQQAVRQKWLSKSRRCRRQDCEPQGQEYKLRSSWGDDLDIVVDTMGVAGWCRKLMCVTSRPSARRTVARFGPNP